VIRMRFLIVLLTVSLIFFTGTAEWLLQPISHELVEAPPPFTNGNDFEDSGPGFAGNSPLLPFEDLNSFFHLVSPGFLSENFPCTISHHSPLFVQLGSLRR
jgi:hypothetical protein